MSAALQVTDKGYKALMARLDKATKERALTVGIHQEAGAAASEGGASVIDIASMHEFGLGQDQRSFIGAWAEANEADHKANLFALGTALVKGSVKDPVQGLEQLGEKYVGEVQARIASGIAPPNRPSTVARKGSSTPLVDKGVLRSSITKEVR